MMCIVMSLFSGALVYSQEGIVVISYNIRYDEPNDGPDRWEKRKKDLVRRLVAERPDFLGTQEGLHHQLIYLDREMEGYARIGVGRDDGGQEGEYTALFYRTDRWSLLEEGTFWLSGTPDRVSLGWDAVCNRVATFGVFANADGDTILVMNAHLDHAGKEARKQSIRLIMDRIRAFGIERVILTGDFNLTPEDANYLVLTGMMEDARRSAARREEGYPGTYNGFEKNGKFDRRIDYVFLSQIGFGVGNYAVPDWRRRNGRQVSDHFPVIVELSIIGK
jgi:endonuclease/exonuclease/phosphatase family metal-dependent hydrolase